MKRLSTVLTVLTVLTVALALLVIAASAAAEAPPPSPPGRTQVLSAAREVMRQAQLCTLVTLDEGGQPQARVMDPAEPDPDFVVWIATNSKSRKVAQLAREPRAALSYFDRATMSYVTLLGSATLVSDAELKVRHWQPKWAPFYPQGAKTSNLLLIRFVPRRLEIVSAPHKLTGDTPDWRPVSVDFR